MLCLANATTLIFQWNPLYDDNFFFLITYTYHMLLLDWLGSHSCKSASFIRDRTKKWFTASIWSNAPIISHLCFGRYIPCVSTFGQIPPFVRNSAKYQRSPFMKVKSLQWGYHHMLFEQSSHQSSKVVTCIIYSMLFWCTFENSPLYLHASLADSFSLKTAEPRIARFMGIMHNSGSLQSVLDVGLSTSQTAIWCIQAYVYIIWHWSDRRRWNFLKDLSRKQIDVQYKDVVPHILLPVWKLTKWSLDKRIAKAHIALASPARLFICYMLSNISCTNSSHFKSDRQML